MCKGVAAVTEVMTGQYGVVAIGRNEGDRLRRCLLSAQNPKAIVYVDSGSSDGSVQWAKNQGFEVVELDISQGFTAARARNAGFRRLRELAPDVIYVQFVDGDCELVENWPYHAVSYLENHSQAGAVFGRRRERYPERSIYNRICDSEWDIPVGETRLCGGDVMIRVSALDQVGGYRDDFIAGEEPELCVRLRAAGWSIWRIDREMTRHDAAITRFAQWWRRNVRSGYAFATGRFWHGSPPEGMWVWECRRARFWGIIIPASCAAGFVLLGPTGLLPALLYPVQLLRRIPYQNGRWSDRIQFAFFEVLGRFPESVGQLKFEFDRLLRCKGQIIEYK